MSTTAGPQLLGVVDQSWKTTRDLHSSSLWIIAGPAPTTATREVNICASGSDTLLGGLKLSSNRGGSPAPTGASPGAVPKLGE